MTERTIFHKIIDREIPADIVYETDDIIAFKDISPLAETHVLFVPKKTLRNLDDATEQDKQVLGELMLAAADYARKQGIAQDGYRVVMNCNAYGGQTVYQMHLHLLGGEPLGHFGAAAKQ